MTTRARFDERIPGGRIKGLVFLIHPGPSLLVTAVTAAAAVLLSRVGVSAGTVLGVVLIMLPMQLAIGALNDWADADADRRHKPYKPIARGTVGRGLARTLAGIGFAVCLATAAHWGLACLLIAGLGVASGASYDLGLKRTPLSFLCFWGGLQCVVLLVTHVAGVGGSLLTLPLAGLLALALQISNALPDLDGDRAAGAVTIPVLVGAITARWVTVMALVAAAVYAGVAGGGAGLGRGAVVAALALGLAAVLTGALPAPLLRRAGFALLAVLAAASAISWLGALPDSAV